MIYLQYNTRIIMLRYCAADSFLNIRTVYISMQLYWVDKVCAFHLWLGKQDCQ
jgi:hypothetical protein